MACTCGKCAECDWARHHPDEDDVLRSGPGETDDLAGALGLTDSAERQLGVVMLSQKAIRDIETQFERAERYRDIANRLMEHYVGLFPDCAWVDEESAIGRMASEIRALRREKESLEETLSELRRMDQMRDA